MLIRIAAIGRLKRGPLADLAEDYRKRVAQQGRGLGVTGCEIAEAEAKRGLAGAALMAAEGDLLRRQIPPQAVVIAPDERGTSEPSPAFAERLGGYLQTSRPLCFLIGGADGLEPTLRDEADHRLALGAMTWPHMMARVLVLEQIYRAVSILTNHPYHRD